MRSLIGFYHVQLLGNRRIGRLANFSESNLTELVDLVSRTHHFQFRKLREHAYTIGAPMSHPSMRSLPSMSLSDGFQFSLWSAQQLLGLLRSF